MEDAGAGQGAVGSEERVGRASKPRGPKKKKRGHQKPLETPNYTPAPNRKYDYELLRTQFIEGIEKDGDIHLPTLKELSELHTVPYQRVRERSSKERWNDRRAAHQEQIVRERQRQRSKQIVKQVLDFDEKAHTVAKLGINMVTVRLAEIAELVAAQKQMRTSAIERLKNGELVEKQELYSAVNPRELESLASAADRFQQIGMKALGTDVQKHEISGPEGGAIETTVNISAELVRDDPHRLAHLIQAMKEAGIDQQAMFAGALEEGSEDPATAGDNNNIIDVEEVQEDEGE